MVELTQLWPEVPGFPLVRGSSDGTKSPQILHLNKLAFLIAERESDSLVAHLFPVLLGDVREPEGAVGNRFEARDPVPSCPFSGD